MSEFDSIIDELERLDKNIILIYAFNGTGKTRLSFHYREKTKINNVTTGVYYNAYSEDLFSWDNGINIDDTENKEIKLNIVFSALNSFHSLINEQNVREKLNIFNPTYDFEFDYYENNQEGIKSIRFYSKKTEKPNSSSNDNENERQTIKISRGEEQNFIWCFFLALFDAKGWYNQNEKNYFFIDDPVSSLDDHNIFMTASTIYDLIANHYERNKIILTTHHIGIFSILHDWLNKGEKASTYKKSFASYILSNKNNKLQLEKCQDDVLLYHLKLMQLLQKAIENKELFTYHFVILRQILENISSFLGVGRFSYVLEQLDLEHEVLLARIINTLSHENVFKYKSKKLEDDNVKLITNVFNKLKNKYNFVLHAS